MLPVNIAEVVLWSVFAFWVALWTHVRMIRRWG